MDEMKMPEVRELTMEEMDMATGGAFKPLPPKKGFIVYQILKGDTLNKISRKFNCTAADILKWNPKITNQNKLYNGDYLYIKP